MISKILIHLLLFTLAIESYSIETYFVVFVKGKVIYEGDQLTKDVRINSDQIGEIEFSSAQDLVIVIGSKTGKQVLKQFNGDKNTVSAEWRFYGETVMLPVRQKNSTRAIDSDYVDFLNFTQFLLADQLYIPEDQSITGLGIKSNSVFKSLTKKDGHYILQESDLPSTINSIIIYSQGKNNWVELAEIYFSKKPIGQYKNEIKIIYEVGKAGNENEAINEVLGYTSVNYGYYPVDLIKEYLDL